VLPAEYHRMHALETNHWWFLGRRRVLLNILQYVERPKNLLRLLDYGCGTGSNTQAYAALGEVIGFDLDRTALGLAQQRGGGIYCCGTGTQLPFPENSFDVVVASDVLEHIEDDHAALIEIVRVLNWDGIAIITVPAHQWLFSDHDAALHHFRRYSKEGLRKTLERSGLRVRRLSYWNMCLFPLISIHRLLRRRGAPQNLRSDTGPTNRMINRALAQLVSLEAAVLRHVALPWGTSLVAIAERARPGRTTLVKSALP
jgi:SAM-dependent methyltransferase